MGYRPSTRVSRKLEGRRERLRPKSSRSHLGSKHYLDEKSVPTPQEVVDRTISRLRTLGDQRFALPPFYDHFDRWLMNLKEVLSDFQSSSGITVDDEFRKEHSQTTSDIERELNIIRFKESAAEKAARGLAETRKLLERVDDEYAKRRKEIGDRKARELERVLNNLNALRAELNRIAHMKTGLLRGITKRAKEEKEAEANRRISSAEREFEGIEESFDSEQDRLRRERDRKREETLERGGIGGKDVEKVLVELQSDSSLEVRRATCEALTNAIDALLSRSQMKSNHSP